MSTDYALWLFMVVTGFMAAGISLCATAMDQRGAAGHRSRFGLHMTSYVLMSVSILAFAARGLIGP